MANRSRGLLFLCVFGVLSVRSAALARAILRNTMQRGGSEMQDQARDFGVDPALIDANLRLPVEERMRRHFERVRMYQRMSGAHADRT